MEQKTRIRINLNTREVEWEGSEAFLEKYSSVIDEFIQSIKDQPVASPRYDNSTVDQSASNPVGNNSVTGLPDSFGEYYTSFPRNIKVVDKMLVASYFVQQKSSDGLFTIKEASDLLLEQNVLITNANAFIRSLLTTGKLFKNGGKYKVSEKGIENVKQLRTIPL